MYSLAISPSLKKKLAKLGKKDPKLAEIIFKKVGEIVQDPHQYKNLRAPLQEWKRVHIDKHFVLTFSIDDDSETVVLEDLDHHDSIYKH
jgi:YafQ family addiction module toxin component